MSKIGDCNCGKGAGCCRATGISEGGCGCGCGHKKPVTERSFAERAEAARQKVLVHGKTSTRIHFDSEKKELCAFIVREVKPLGRGEVVVLEEIFVFLGEWDEPRALRSGQRILGDSEKIKETVVLLIIEVSFNKGISFMGKMEGIGKKKGLIPPPFEK